MIGAIVGDIVGSRFEFFGIKSKEFDLFTKQCEFTDDTVMSVAMAFALRHYDEDFGCEGFKKTLVTSMHVFGELYPNCGYGNKFELWVRRKETKPYNSFGNGSAVRVSPVAWYATSLEEAEAFAKASAEVTHNHPEGIKGAQAIAGAIFLARTGKTKEEIREYVSKYYNIDFTLDEIRPTYSFSETCQGSVPQALEAFFESTDFEDAIRNAVSLGGDSDTIAAMTGSIAEAYYGVPKKIKEKALGFLDKRLKVEVNQFLRDFSLRDALLDIQMKIHEQTKALLEIQERLTDEDNNESGNVVLSPAEWKEEEERRAKKKKVNGVRDFFIVIFAILCVVGLFYIVQWDVKKEEEQEYIYQNATTVAVVVDKYAEEYKRGRWQLYVVAEHESVDQSGEKVVFEEVYKVPADDYCKIEIGDSIITEYVPDLGTGYWNYVSYEER